MKGEDRPQDRRAPSFTCGSCAHYYVTWDKRFPHGCRAMGFKCRSAPSRRVQEASGIACQLYVRKGPKGA